MTRQDAADILRALLVFKEATPRMIKRINGGRIPHIRAELKELETLSAAVKVGKDAWTAGPEARAVFERADWHEDDGTPDPGWF
jgi:hypothetical protein